MPRRNHKPVRKRKTPIIRRGDDKPQGGDQK